MVLPARETKEPEDRRQLIGPTPTSRPSTSTGRPRTRSAICATPMSTCSATSLPPPTAAFGDKACKAVPEPRRSPRWVGYDLDGRTDIKWTFSFLVACAKKRDGLSGTSATLPGACVRASAKACESRRRLSAADDRQARSRPSRPSLRRSRPWKTSWSEAPRLQDAANVVTQGDGYNLVSAGPLIEILDQIIDRRRSAARRRSRLRRSSVFSRPPASACRPSICASTPCRSTTPSAPSCTRAGRTT